MNGIEKLPETMREDYKACEVDGMGIKERARQRGVSAPTVSHNVQTAKRKLEIMEFEQ